MERSIDHSTHTDGAEGAAPSTRNTERDAAPARTIFKPLFFIALLLAAALGGLAAFFYARSLAREQDAALLNAGKDFMRQQLEQAQSDLAAARDALALREDELAQARDTIDFLAEYSVAAPDGTVPEYTRLYPDFYAPEWTGEEVTGGKVCCLTFDDGPSANTDRVLNTLDQYGIKGTFFIVGSAAGSAASQQRMRDIVAGGHTLAMHSWSHDYKKVYASVEAFLDEFYRLYQWIYEVTGVYPSVYRFPGGSINGYDRGVYQEIIAEMTRRGFVYFDWNASAQDATVTPVPAETIAQRCLNGVGKDLVVVLCHDSAARGPTADALPAVIEGYQAAGYTFSALHPGVTPVTMGYPRIR